MQRDGKKIKDITKGIKKVIEHRKDIAAVYLFGSYGTEYQNEHSDIDLGIIFLPEAKINLGKELELDVDISMALEADNVDVINLNRSPIQLRYQAIAEGKLIYEVDYIATSNFIEGTINFYLDYAHHLKEFYLERTKALKEAYGIG
ncbi:MAG: nucleotidyltransferase domain-containing protein [Firmicutes bacterium]|nr:nucleotidyltransferase domain-containing protein [Bacillota bacterium]